MKNNRTVTGFVDGVDWLYELGEADGGNRIYPSLEDLLENSRCAKSCGVVKVRVSLIDWVMEQNWDNLEAEPVYVEEVKKNPDLRHLEGALAHLKFLEERIENQKNKVEALKKKVGNQ